MKAKGIIITLFVLVVFIVFFRTAKLINPLFFSWLTNDGALTKQEIISLVTKNEEVLKKASNEVYSSRRNTITFDREGVKIPESDAIPYIKIEERHIIEQSIENALQIKGVKRIQKHDGIVRYDCGIAYSTFVGFYYCKDNVPHNMIDGKLEKSGNGYACEQYQCEYYTERIIDGFYYYSFFDND